MGFPEKFFSLCSEILLAGYIVFSYFVCILIEKQRGGNPMENYENNGLFPEEEIQEEQLVMMNQLGDAIKTFIDNYNVEKQYAMIITNNGGSPVVAANPALNITDDVLAGLNDEYIKSKNNKSK